MSECIEIGLKQWNDTSSDILAVDLSELKIKTSRHTNPKKQQFNIVDIDGRNGEPRPTILTSMSHWLLSKLRRMKQAKYQE